MPSFKFICGTPKDKSENSSPLFHNVFDLRNDVVTVRSAVEYSNTRGLPDVYNQHAEGATEDFLIFIHDDVIINDIEIFRKILKYSDRFDLMGVAGTSSLNMFGEGALSWMCSLNKNHLTCNVTHPMKDSPDTYTLGTNYGIAPRRAIALDGLMLIASRKAYTSIKFDPLFKFDFYDMDYCLSAHEKGLELGVIPVPVTHLSGGYGILKPQYAETQKIFIEKWSSR